MCVLDLQGCLGGQFLLTGIRMSVRIQGFPEYYCTVVRCSVLFISSVSGFKVVADCASVRANRVL